MPSLLSSGEIDASTVVVTAIDNATIAPAAESTAFNFSTSWHTCGCRVRLTASSLEYPINQHCSIILPLKRSDAPLGGNNFPTDKYRLIMPTVELFGNADGDRFLKKSEQQGLPIILWIVDTLSLLHKALLMRGVQGVISNHPVRLKRMYEEICGSKYTGGIL